MKKVLLFSDPGIDDSLAIMYALLHPQIQLVGVVTGYGNVTKEQATQNAAYLFDLANVKNIPIIGGAQGPLSGEIVPFYPEIHGQEGLGPIQPPEEYKVNLLNFDEVYQIIDEYENELIIASVGRLTDLAVAFILGGDYMSKVKAIYTMGGAFLVPGNVTAVAEANFHGDPIAADFVVEKARNLTILPLNVTNKAIMTPEMADYLDESNHTPFKKLIKPIFEYYYEAYKKNVPGIPGTPLHDVVTFSAIVNPTFFKYLKRRVRVVTSGQVAGQSIADFRVKPDPEPEETQDQIAIEMDYKAFINDFLSIMTRENSIT
ncbi:nucleoside hydrolase [Bacillus suaedaesalsae]|uniref:Nucleoside hydrolase n=1 Tax=Bacillus suaedaesalsae TaxID=2810349 RepID=A0ABS2DF07_9BACI|nr:nucleoside hydrolase [Bacillus suaedaesalsae]MBM6617048.1 nucleoside hydrolase [Bacillus suaedaesalsae]